MTAAEIIRAAIPGADADLCEHILWARTPFPCGAVTAHSLYDAARQYKRATDNGRRLCDFCRNLAVPDNWACVACLRALGRAA